MICVFIRSCLKTQDFAHETLELYKKRKIYFDACLIFRTFSVFCGQKIVFKHLLTFIGAERLRAMPPL